MRIRAAVAAPLLALVLLAGCGDDEDPAVDDATEDEAGIDVDEEPTDDEATVDGDEEAGDPRSESDLDAAVTAAQLEVDDLGTDWELTETKPAGADDDEPNPLDDCLGTDIADRFDEAKVAESEERTFTRTSEGALPTQLSASSVALDDPSLFAEQHELFRSDDFSVCLAEAFEEQVAESAAGAEMTMGEIVASEGVVDPDAADGLESTGLVVPLTISVDGASFETQISVIVLSTGQVGSMLFMFGPVDDVQEESLAEWGRLLAERLAGS